MNTADMMIHMHSELNVYDKAEISRWLESRIGVDCAAFSHRPNSHALLVKYDPDALKGIEILQAVRRLDPVATMVGL